MFSFYKKWIKGKTLVLTKDNFGCGGASHHLFSRSLMTKKEFVSFLADDEGLKANHALMEEWIDNEEKPRLRLRRGRRWRAVHLLWR